MTFDYLTLGTQPVKVKGFLLQNGKGRFYPLEIVTSAGKQVLTQEDSYKSIERGRSELPFEITLLIFFLISAFWLLINAFQLKRNIAKANKHGN